MFLPLKCIFWKIIFVLTLSMIISNVYFSKYLYSNNVDSTLKTPKTYSTNQLFEWLPAPIVLESADLPGEMGRPVTVPDDLQKIMKERFNENKFNVVASEMISANRSLPDFREEECKHIKFPSTLPKTSVVIVFHNEAWSTLIRTIWSVINRSPKSLVKEIILVDDASDHEFLREQLNLYVKTLPIKTFVVPTNIRSGLMKARLLGAKYVTSDVITFLDAHCECTEGWLEPLLNEISLNRHTAVAPIIDIISDETFQYVTATSNVWGGFTWKLWFQWVYIPEREWKRLNYSKSMPLNSPTMAGGLFSIDRNFFYEIGSYDEEMEIWGAENLEMSFRIWMCGGNLKLHPCSRVGHVYRKETPYKFPKGSAETVSYNINRLVNVWLDDWVDFFYKTNPEVKGSVNVDKRLELRKNLNCKNFKWYLENIYPESSFPMSSYKVGQIRSIEIDLCLETTGKAHENITIMKCEHLKQTQLFIFTDKMEIRSHEHCLDATVLNVPLTLYPCHGLKGNQQWEYDSVNKTFIHYSKGCLTRPSIDEPYLPILRNCDGTISQKWSFDEHEATKIE